MKTPKAATSQFLGQTRQSHAQTAQCENEALVACKWPSPFPAGLYARYTGACGRVLSGIRCLKGNGFGSWIRGAWKIDNPLRYHSLHSWQIHGEFIFSVVCLPGFPLSLKSTPPHFAPHCKLGVCSVTQHNPSPNSHLLSKLTPLRL